MHNLAQYNVYREMNIHITCLDFIYKKFEITCLDKIIPRPYDITYSFNDIPLRTQRFTLPTWKQLNGLKIQSQATQLMQTSWCSVFAFPLVQFIVSVQITFSVECKIKETLYHKF